MQLPGLSVSIAGLPRGEGLAWTKPRGAIAWAAGFQPTKDAAGVRAIQLDGTMPGLRARELDRSARRDLASVLRRAELALSGVDLWIPPEHFEAGEHQDRAVAAVIDAAGLLGDVVGLVGLGSPTLCVRWPKELNGGVRAAMVAAADARGVVIADFGKGETQPPIGVGVDPATVMFAGGDAAAAASAAGDRLRAARLSDADEAGRRVVGEGRLDV
ncbi:MAG: hypothetical protein AAF747_03920, partial [Planctomycetota bacterium]